MTKIAIDTTQYDQLVDDFNTCVNNYIESINTFFELIETNTGWHGDAASSYIDKVKSEKIKYINFGDSLENFAITLKDVGTTIETIPSSLGR